jgi:peptidoglycan hydrolase-like protein with peptidoglycan-binding domain
MSDHNEQFFASFGATAGYGGIWATAADMQERALYANLPFLSERHVKTGARVIAWRRDLNSLPGDRYNNVPHQGDWDAGLTAATKKFQADQGIDVDGIVGPDALSKMQAARQAQGQSQSTSNIAASNTPLAGAEAVSHSSGGGGGGGNVLSTSGGGGGEIATTEPFLEQEAWEGGPTKGKALGIGGLIIGGLGLVFALVSSLKPSQAPVLPAPGMANREW